MRFFFAFYIFCAYLCPRTACAQALTSGADFLLIDSGARSAGMGGAFTSVADDVNSLTWNPAGLALLQRPEVGYLHMLYLSDIAYNFGGVALPLQAGENTFGLGAGVINLGVPAFDSTLGIAPTVSAGDNAFLLSAAYRVKDIISFGVTGKYIMQNLAGYNAAAFGGDVGLLVTPGNRFRIGAGVFNIGQQVEFISAADPLPITARLGVSYKVLDIPHHSLLLSVDDAYEIQAQDDQVAGGFEYWFDKVLALRAGYEGDSTQQNWTAGLGISVDMFKFDYAFAPLGTLGDTNRFSLTLEFGGPVGALLAPTGFAAKPFEGGITLSWRPAESKDVAGYVLYVKKPGATDFKRITRNPILSSETSVKLRNMEAGQTYTFALASVSAGGRESSPVEVAAVPLALPASSSIAAAQPAPSSLGAGGAPTGFRAAAISTGINLTWDAVAGAAGYNLYLADENGKPVKKLSPNLLTANQVALKVKNPDTLFRFILTSVDKTGAESVPTAVLRAKLGDLRSASMAKLIPPPVTVQAGDGMAVLTLQPVAGAAGYNLYKSDDAKTFVLLTKAHPLQGPQIRLNKLANGTTYFFGVSTVAADGRESDKTTLMVTPAAGLANP